MDKKEGTWCRQRQRASVKRTNGQVKGKDEWQQSSGNVRDSLHSPDLHQQICYSKCMLKWGRHVLAITTMSVDSCVSTHISLQLCVATVLAGNAERACKRSRSYYDMHCAQPDAKLSPNHVPFPFILLYFAQKRYTCQRGINREGWGRASGWGPKCGGRWGGVLGGERAHLPILKHVCGALSPKIKNIASKHPSQCQLQALAPVLNSIKIPVCTAASPNQGAVAVLAKRQITLKY